MFIEFEQTPNPETLKFLPGLPVLAEGVRQYTGNGDPVHPPRLAARLLALEGVAQIFLGADFVAVTKRPEFLWEPLKPAILTEIMEHFAGGGPVFTEAELQAMLFPAGEPQAEEDGEIVRQIKELIETRVRPAVARDGGNIEFVAFRDGIVTLRMQGACAGCPSAAITLKNGVETMLRHYVPEVRAVEQEEY